jgi:hypothetical protein
MDAERARVKLYDEESILLGEPIEQPMDKGKDGEPDKAVWPFEVCLRVPANVNAKIAGRYGVNVPLFRYVGEKGISVYVAAGMIVEKNKENIYKPGEYTNDDFRQGVRFGLKKAYEKLNDFTSRLLQEQPVKDTRQPQSWRGETLPALEFDKYEGSDKDNKRIKENSAFELYIHREGNRQVAIVYQVPEDRAKDKQVIDAIDYSLKSLDIGEQAASRRAEAASQCARRQGRRTP